MLLSREMPMKTVADIWERLIAGSGAWRADYIEAAHATVPERRCDESRLMKPAPCGGHRGAFNVPAFPRWSRRLKMRLRPLMGLPEE